MGEVAFTHISGVDNHKKLYDINFGFRASTGA